MDSRFTNILKGGLIATTVMTLVMLIAPMIGMPKLLDEKLQKSDLDVGTVKENLRRRSSIASPAGEFLRRF